MRPHKARTHALHHFFLSLVLALGASTVRAQGTAIDESQRLQKQASDAYDAKHFEDSIQLYRRALHALDSTKRSKAWLEQSAAIHYNTACDLALLGRANEALEELRRAVDDGASFRAAAEQDKDLATLHSSPAFSRLMQRMSDNGAARRVYQVRIVANPDLDRIDNERFAGIGSPVGRELRARYKLDDVVQGKRTQIERQLALLDWVHRQWKHDGNQESDDKSALAILRQVAQGKRFACVDYAYTLRDVLMAFGYAARIPVLLPDLQAEGIGHRVTEVWNDELQKWIVLDGQNNAVWRDGERYLDAAEVRDLLLGKRSEHVRFERAPSPWYSVRAEEEPEWRSAWGANFAHLVIDGANLIAPGENVILINVKTGTPLQVRWTGDVREVYPRLNLVHVDLLAGTTKSAPDSTLEIRLTNSMPGFDHYHVARGGARDDDTKSSSVLWSLAAGKNVLEVWAVNAAGVRGASSRVEVVYYPPRR